MVKISVVIPVYNVEDYLDETLNSLLNQTMIDDMEVIMVDDGSTDNSRYIIEKYALDYDNFHAFHKENEGQSIARNYGMSKAEGEFIHFLDSDDYLPPNAFETLYNLDEGNDIIIGNALRFSNYDSWEDLLFKNSYGDLSEITRNVKLSGMPSLMWDTSTSNKIYRREFLQKNNLEFPNKKIFYEDLIFALKTYVCAESITITPEIFYYWRYRSQKTSVSQQNTNVVNFRDRLEILKMSYDVMNEHALNQDLINYEFSKWLNHDLRFFLKRIKSIPSEYHRELLDKTNEILSLIPDELKDNLNSYKRILYRMAENNDLDALLSFAHLEDELMHKQEILPDLDEEYAQMIDFNRDSAYENLICDVRNADNDENNIILKFTHAINYLSDDYPHEINAYLVDGDEEHQLEVDNDMICLPIALLENRTHAKVKVSYICDMFEKECYIRNHSRKTLRFDGFEIDLGITFDWQLIINHEIISKDNSIEITDIFFEDDVFMIQAKSSAKISQVYISNLVSFERRQFSVSGSENEFSFRMDYKDILNAPVKKWEMNSDDAMNSIKLARKFEFYTETSHIRFIYARNKVLIENTLKDKVDVITDLNDKLTDARSEIRNLKRDNKKLNDKNQKLIKDNEKLTNQNKSLKSKNQELTDSNNKLNDELGEFKSRKVVRFADKIKKI